tara:strand:- start:47 stop:1057 length:1011 start_codon:yes stop_codon:yes gene_type:complete
LKVLSLFDGMSCGQIALDQLGIPVDTYYASEIDKYAIQVTQANYPNTVQVGDVTKLDPKDFADVDLIFFGAPCQGFSFAGKQLAFDDPRSALFFEAIRLLKAIKPKYFLAENVRMKKEFLDIFSQEVSKCYPEIAFGISPILINSSLLSAQSRQRYYWTNIPNIQQPKDKGIVLKDILETDVNDELSQEAKDYMNRSSDKWSGGKTRKDVYIKHESEKGMCLTANMHKGVPYGVIAVNKPKQVGMASSIKGHDILRRVYSPEGKSPTLNTMGGGNREPKVAQEDLTWRKLTCRECERLQTVPDDYTNHVSKTQRLKMLGNGMTVEVIKHILQNMET